MSGEFRGFTVTSDPPESLYEYYRFTEEGRHFLSALVNRLQPRIASARFNAGRDVRGGRDYYFENVEIHIRGRKDPSFLGLFHYLAPEERAGSWFQLWEWEHDDNPCINVPVAELIEKVLEATEKGRLSEMLSNIAADIKKQLGLH